MNRKWFFVVAAALLGLAAVPGIHAAEMSEKEKALASPYPNDLATDEEMKEIDTTVKTYPENIQAGYKLLMVRCAQCHEPRRPLNSRFVEPEGGMDDAKQQANLDAWKKANPEIFKDSTIWQPEVKVWNRYVKRMMNKPGCNIEKAEGKKIWEFLEYDGAHRKVGANAAKWAAHRKDLLERFKAKNPKRYEELKAANDL
jgi:mono/diheme cytochrome c family protein